MIVKLELYVRRIYAKILGLVCKILSAFHFVDLAKRIQIQKNSNKINLYVNDEFIRYVRKKRVGIDLKKDAITTLALRGSNTDYGIDPLFFPGLYNLGLTSTDLYTSYYLYESFKKQLPNLQNIIVTVNVLAPGYALVYTPEYYRSVVYGYYFDIPPRKGKPMKKRYVNYIKKICRKHAEENEISIEDNYFGYNEKNKFLTNQDMKVRAKSQLRANVRMPGEIKWIKKLVDTAHIDNIKLVIVIPPFRSDFKEVLPVKDQLFKRFYEFESECDIIDLYDNELFDDSDFGDGDHFNAKGTQKFTTELYNRIENK